VGFCLEFWRKFNLKSVTWNCFEPECKLARHRAARTPRRPCRTRATCACQGAGGPSGPGPRRRHCASRSNDARRKPRPVPRGLCTLAGGRTAIRHWPPVRRTSPPPPRPCRCSCRPRRSGKTASTHHRAYKTPPSSFLARDRANPAVRRRRH
jgi:hypothetical protein